MIRRTVFTAALLAGLAATTTAPLSAQLGGREDGFGRGRAGGLVVGARGGYDFRSDAPMLGAFARATITSRFALQPNAELTFLDGLTERQYGVDLLINVGQGFAVGGGPVVRNSVYGDTGTIDDRENKTGYSVVALIGGVGGPGRVITGLELRYTAVDNLVSRTLSIQLGIILARW